MSDPISGGTPQTNHIKTISPYFSRDWSETRPPGRCASTLCTDARRGPGWRSDDAQACAGSCVPRDHGRAGATCIAYAHGGGAVMPTQDERDAMTKAWTYAVLDALEAADDNIRLEIVRILCPAGFVVVPRDETEACGARKN